MKPILIIALVCAAVWWLFALTVLHITDYNILNLSTLGILFVGVLVVIAKGVDY
jgi:hypothetical protein